MPGLSSPAAAHHETPALSWIYPWMGVCFLAIAYRLGELPPYHTDESYYVEAVRNMAASGDYLTPYYHEKKRFAKPILIYWLMALSCKTFGFSAAAARLWSAVFGTAGVGLVFLLGRLLFTPRAGMLAALILPGLYLHFQVARWATTDMALGFFTLAAFYFFAAALFTEQRRGRMALLAWLAMSMGFLTKGPPALLLPLLTVLAFLALTRQWRLWAGLRALPGLLLVLALNLPWFGAMIYLHGGEFTSHLLGAEVHDRVIHATPFSLYYFGVLLRYTLPWPLFLIAALLYAGGFCRGGGNGAPSPLSRISASGRGLPAQCRRLTRRENHPLLFCLLGILVPLILFTLLRIRHSRYLLSAAPFIALILAHFFCRLAGAREWTRLPLIRTPLLLTACLYILAGVGIGLAVPVFSLLEPAPLRVWLAPCILLGGGGALLRLYHQRGAAGQIIRAISIVQILAFASISGDALPFFNFYPMQRFAAAIAKDAGNSAPIAVYKQGSNRSRLGILTARMALDISEPQALRAFTASRENRYVVMSETDWQAEFKDAPLSPVARERLWSRQDAPSPVWRTARESGLRAALESRRETLVLLARRDAPQ